MTGQDFQDKLDAIVLDLQTKGKGQTITVTLRDSENVVTNYNLSSDANGVVDANLLSDLQMFITSMGSIADIYTSASVPVQSALDAFKTASEPHEALATAATLARKNLNDALEADTNYQTAKTALENARQDPDYISAVADYKSFNVSENFGNLGDAKGKYLV